MGKVNKKRFGVIEGKVQEIVPEVHDNAIAVYDRNKIQALWEKSDSYLEITDKSFLDQEANSPKIIGRIGIDVFHTYLEQLKELYLPVECNENLFDAENRMRFFDIKKWVVDAEEQNIDKLVNVYHVLCGDNCNIALIYNRKSDKCEVTLAVVNTDEDQCDPAVADNLNMRLMEAMKGNFPGIEIGESDNIGIPDSIGHLDDVLEGTGKVKSVAMISNIASEKSEKFISQSMEKLLDGIVPQRKDEEYTIILLARPMQNNLAERAKLYDYYTKLSLYSSAQYSSSDSATVGEQDATTTGINEAYNHSVGTHGGFEVFGGFSYNYTYNIGRSYAKSISSSSQIGKSVGVTRTQTNYSIKHTLDNIEKQLARLEEGAALGLWQFATYVVSDSPVVAENVAHMYASLTQGDKSYLSSSKVNFWDGNIENLSARCILNYVKNLRHPEFALNDLELDDEWLVYPPEIYPTILVTGKELAKSLNFPRKSVSGFPVMEVVSFGREPHTLTSYDLNLRVGSGYHMRKIVPGQEIKINKEELTKHTFITGSTGSGKSNTIYKILDGLNEEKVRFLVIEPAKGEYKSIFGYRDDVTVFGTNPNKQDSHMLRINPFSFPNSVHILEHLDRLIEIFNVCWPMYAAMPAILKESVERAYKNCGWNLEKSSNKYSNEFFPTFRDVVREIKDVLDESAYSDDNKGDYIGSLVTRLNSLTNGINGLIFTSNEVGDDILFDRNVIVDLSRVGSVETKSLIMGLMIIKLQEHRADQRENGVNVNENLKHVTILEEAHHILRKTSTEQFAEGSNLQGKSVEMLTNSIAEMRTYGEGFVIADQAPSLLDASVIKNTNTKIILRLPDYDDRWLVGKAAGLSDKQIEELVRLEKGVAVISQSDWIEPVLCKVDKHDFESNPLRKNSNLDSEIVDTEAVSNSILECIMNLELYRKGEKDELRALKDLVILSNLDSRVKVDFLEYLTSNKEEDFERFRKLVYNFFSSEEAIKQSEECGEIEEWTRSVVKKLMPSIEEYSEEQIHLLVNLILYEKSLRDAEYRDLFCRYLEVYKLEEGMH